MALLRRGARRLQPSDRRLVDRLQPGLDPRRQRTRHGHPQPAPRARRDRPRRPRNPVHLLGLRRQDPLSRPPAILRHRRRRPRQRDDGKLLVLDADRAAQPQEWKTRVELANAIFDYIEIFHNRHRRHSALGYRTPIEYELLAQRHHPRCQLATATGTHPVGQVRLVRSVRSPTGAESHRRWTTAGVGSSNSSMLGESPCRLTTAAPRTPRHDRYLRQAMSCRGASACPGSVLHFAHSSGDVCSLVDFARLPGCAVARAARLMPRGADGPVGVKAPGAVCNFHVQLRFRCRTHRLASRKHGLRSRSGAVSPGFPLKYAGSPVS